MTLEPVDPFKRLEELRRRSSNALDQLLANVQGVTIDDQPIAFQPDVDLVETKREFRFYISIPGMVEDDFLIDVDGYHLTIRGERKPPYDAELRKASMQEWRYGFFHRQFKLPVLISISSIRATYDSGVLTIVAEKLDVPSGAEDIGGPQGGRSDVEDSGTP